MKAGYAQNKAGYSGCYLPGVGIPGLYGLRRLLTVAVFLLLGACQSDEQEQNLYFPLENDWRWQYRVTEDLIDQQNERTFVIENRGLAEFQWPDNDPGPVYIRRTSDGTDYYFSRDETGIHRIARRTLVEYQPRFDSTPRMVLPVTPDPDSGFQWHLETRPYALRPGRMMAIPDPGEQAFTLAYEVLDDQAVVRVPAGEFRHCLKVKGLNTINIYADPRTGYEEVTITQTEWYAPGVGLVKLVRDEPMDLELFKGGTITFELEKLSH